MTDSTPLFVRLSEPRRILPEWPNELAEFYANYEGHGRKSEPRSIRLCTQKEVTPVSWCDLHVLGGDPVPEGWDSFRALRIGIGLYFEEILWIVHSPVCSAGSILAMGISIIGPGGSGPSTIEPSLVLATSLHQWFMTLARDEWDELALHPDPDNDLGVQDRFAEVLKLSPLMDAQNGAAQ